MKLIVRCPDRMVFEVDRKTLDPKRCSVYDAYCYTDPDKDVEYMEYSDWVVKRNKQFRKEIKSKLGYSRIGLWNV